MTTYNTITTDKEFSKVVGQFKEGQVKARERLQSLIEYGLAKYAANGDASNLSKALTIAIEVKALNSKAIKEYIKDHANVKWIKTTDGTMKFAKDSKKSEPIVEEVKVPFWESSHMKKSQAKPDFVDPIAELKAAFAKLEASKRDGKMVAARVSVFDDLLSRVKSVLDEVPAMTKEELAALKA